MKRPKRRKRRGQLGPTVNESLYLACGDREGEDPPHVLKSPNKGFVERVIFRTLHVSKLFQENEAAGGGSSTALGSGISTYRNPGVWVVSPIRHGQARYAGGTVIEALKMAPRLRNSSRREGLRTYWVAPKRRTSARSCCASEELRTTTGT